MESRMDGLELMFQEVVRDREKGENEHECFQRLEDLISGLTVLVEKISCGKKTMGVPHTMEERIGTGEGEEREDRVVVVNWGRDSSSVKRDNWGRDSSSVKMGSLYFTLVCLLETLDLLSNPHAMIGKMDLNSKKTLEQRKGFSQGRWSHSVYQSLLIAFLSFSSFPFHSISTSWKKGCPDVTWHP
ncbi:hypothetical protein VNO80_25939 [Phaseolus coccineus]|uniref:Uncharacterized protein n=1 Tax=Phaseolus coccineus TaxID=3886 RepID=A0AAN9QP57_PHACN